MLDRHFEFERQQRRRMADDLAQNPADLPWLLVAPSDAHDRLARMLQVLRPKTSDKGLDARTLRDLERVCSACGDRRRCARFLRRQQRRNAVGPAQAPAFCPNRASLNELADD